MIMKIKKQKTWNIDKSQRELTIKTFEAIGYAFLEEDDEYLYFIKGDKDE